MTNHISQVPIFSILGQTIDMPPISTYPPLEYISLYASIRYALKDLQRS